MGGERTDVRGKCIHETTDNKKARKDSENNQTHTHIHTHHWTIHSFSLQFSVLLPLSISFLFPLALCPLHHLPFFFIPSLYSSIYSLTLSHADLFPAVTLLWSICIKFSHFNCPHTLSLHCLNFLSLLSDSLGKFFNLYENMFIVNCCCISSSVF